ncbi:MAG: lysophospholipid acyltransferase family protein [Spirochaetales bacterium]|nr:lysophospholipid acyltransferase family protein [Spirochaetales bacterium]
MKRGYHVIFKLVSFFFFGLGGAVFSLVFLPLFLLFVHPAAARKRALRRWASKSFHLFTGFMSLVGVVKLDDSETEDLHRDVPSLICANHPSLLDVVFLISLIPNADCIVKAGHWKNPFLRIILSSMYIPNSLNVEDTVEACRKSLDEGNHIILFPEGTRTPPGEELPRFHRSAAQIALRTGHDIVAVKIGCSEHSGLGKGDKIWDSPPGGVIRYSLHGQGILPFESYKDMSVPVGARQLTKDLKSAIFHNHNKTEDCL